MGALGPSTVMGEALGVDGVSGPGGWETGWAKASDALVGILKAASTFNCSLNCLWSGLVAKKSFRSWRNLKLSATHSAGYGAGCFFAFLDSRTTGLGGSAGNLDRKSEVVCSILVGFQRRKVANWEPIMEVLSVSVIDQSFRG